MENEGIWVYIKRAFIFILIFIMQTVLADRVRLWGIAPNFALAYVLVISFKNYPHYGFYTALIMGLMTDAVSGRVFGSYTFLFVLAEEVIRIYYTKFFSENFFFEFLGGLVFNFFFSLLFAIGEWLFIGNFIRIVFNIAVPEFIYNQIIFTVFLLMAQKKKKKHRSMFRV